MTSYVGNINARGGYGSIMDATFGDVMAVNFTRFSQELDAAYLHPFQLLQFLIPTGRVNIFQIFSVNNIKQVCIVLKETSAHIMQCCFRRNMRGLAKLFLYPYYLHAMESRKGIDRKSEILKVSLH